MADNMTKDTTNNIWPYDIEISGSGWTQTHTFQTQDKYVDANIVVRAHTNAVGALTLALTDITTGLSMGSASGGKYSPVISLSGTVTPATAGWITTGAVNVTDNSVAIGTVNQSTLKNGTTAINSGVTVNPTASSQTINISEGYNAARTVIIGPVSAGPKGTIKSGTASLGTLAYAYSSTNDNFTVTGTASITAPTVPTAGYVSSDSNASVGGTKQTNSNTVTQTVDVITVGSVQDGTFTKAKPVLIRTAKGSSDTWVDAAKGSETDSTTANKPYVRVDAAAIDAYLTTKGTVTDNGYGTTEVFKTSASLSTNVGTQAADSIFIPIKEATIKSPNTTATIGNPTHQTSGTNANKFTIAVSGTIAAPTVSAEGYINNTTNIGTKQTGTISGTKVLNKITVGASIADGSSGTVTPIISRTAKPTADTWTDAASGAATDTKPTSGPYVQVDAPAIDKDLSIEGTVTSEGYGTTSLYNKATALSITAGSAAAVTKYIPITSASGYGLNVTAISGSSDVSVGTLNTTTNKYPIKASNISVTGTFSASTNGWFSSGSATDSDTDNVTIGNMAKATFTVSGRTVYCNGAGYVPTGSTSSYVGQIATGSIAAVASDPGSSYTENTSAVLTEGGWLRLTAGYYSATKISLATLIGDDTSILPAASGYSSVLLAGYKAYDDQGRLLTGSIQTYNGEYTIA